MPHIIAKISNNRSTRAHRQTSTLMRRMVLVFVALIAVTVLVIPGCGSGSKTTGNASGNQPLSLPEKNEDPDMSFVVTEFDIKDIKSQGKPVILNFGDDSPDAQSTLDALSSLYEVLSEHICIVSVDLAEKPDAKSGFPVQVIPSQFFYLDNGNPIPLPIGIGILMSTFTSIDTEEPIFTIHEGPMTAEEFLVVLDHIGAIELQR